MFWSQFQRKWIKGFQAHRKMLNWSALKSTDPGASNVGPNFEIRSLEADLVSFEVARLSERMARLCQQNSKLDQNAYENWKLKALRNGRRKFRTSAQRLQRFPKEHSEQNSKVAKSVGNADCIWAYLAGFFLVIYSGVFFSEGIRKSDDIL